MPVRFSSRFLVSENFSPLCDRQRLSLHPPSPRRSREIATYRLDHEPKRHAVGSTRLALVMKTANQSGALLKPRVRVTRFSLFFRKTLRYDTCIVIHADDRVLTRQLSEVLVIARLVHTDPARLLLAREFGFLDEALYEVGHLAVLGYENVVRFLRTH